MEHRTTKARPRRLTMGPWLLSLAALIVTGLLCGDQAGAAPPKPRGATLNFGPYQLTSQPTREGEYRLFLRKGGEIVNQAESADDPLAKAGRHPGAPRAGCQTLVVRTFSGGAHCCAQALVISLCPGRPDVLQTLGLMHSSELGFVDANGDGIKEMEILDWALAYLEARAKGKDLSLPFSISPVLYRLMVLEDGRWRPDRPGEFSAYHRGKAALCQRQLRGKKTQDPEELCGPAVARAYHMLMAGEPEEGLRAMLGKDLPGPWAEAAEDVLRQVVEAAHGFDPGHQADHWQGKMP